MSTLVTGGAGFIGGALVASLVADGEAVTVIDDLSTARGPDARARVLAGASLSIGDVRDRELLRRTMDGRTRLIHLASTTDIAGGVHRPGVDFAGIVEATQAVCEIAAEVGIDDVWYASSGVVYGRAGPQPSRERGGPLLPESHYAAGKLAAEAIVSGFAHLHGWRALVFRFGNTVGGDSDHGLVHDLVVKLLRTPERLEVLGDGAQRKPFIHVTDLIAGMRHAADSTPQVPVTTLNVGARGALPVHRVVELVIDAVSPLDRPEIVFTGAARGGGGWLGDTPFIEFDTDAIDGR